MAGAVAGGFNMDFSGFKGASKGEYKLKSDMERPHYFEWTRGLYCPALGAPVFCSDPDTALPQMRKMWLGWITCSLHLMRTSTSSLTLRVKDLLLKSMPTGTKKVNEDHQLAMCDLVCGRHLHFWLFAGGQAQTSKVEAGVAG